MADPWGMYKKVTGIKPEQESFLLRHIWGIVVFATIVLMWMGALGLIYSPFVRASDIEKKLQDQKTAIASVQSTSNANAALLKTALKQNKGREIREVLTSICNAKTQAEKSRLGDKKDILQGEYMELAGQNYAEPPCEQLR